MRVRKGCAEVQFNELVLDSELDLLAYDIDPEIIVNKDNIVEYWHSLNKGEKIQFTLFDLNVILFLISRVFDSFWKKDKWSMVKFVDQVVRSKRMEESYKHIIVV
jgi:hypothetical protein